MILGNAFPAEMRNNKVQQALQTGSVLYLDMQFPERSKEKYISIVANLDDDLLIFIINSEINQFIAQRPELANCQIKLLKEDHHFLSHDSYLACQEVTVLKRADVEKELQQDLGRYRGQITENLKQEIIRVMNQSPKKISPRHRKAILQAMASLVIN